MRVLFVCNQNQNRSRTAEEIFQSAFETRSAGLFNEQPISEQEILWADLVVVMEENQRSEIAKRFPKEYLKKKIISLEIPDIYKYNQPELIDVLKSKATDLF
ncbi:MAG: phosphotyrosine protein phosphatase [Nanoarchaeota archaeon]|nr:phosphotyrosine protein phosphatase [Nanoarchaeota archaeon]MBU1322199.1 phosphotyrosine protein phosphatase [Nanoarchaeota archaeon]MBU1597740.1 phosphotyrosine protein phosphatase [Nanoarchaeota archaeon]MBU2442004.1 phosphotyrosine protein phosphatase [Nanoarchaeota archaeon]